MIHVSIQFYYIYIIYHKSIFRNIAAAFWVEAGRKSVVSHLSNSLVERNHLLDPLFSATEVIMKKKPKPMKDDSEENVEDDEDEVLDEEGYMDLPTIGVSSFIV